MQYINHPLIKPDTVEQRLYQLDLTSRALSSPTLVVLPTGLGKTIVALLVIASRLEKVGGKALVLSPTKPLVEQHADFFRKVMNLPEDKILTFTGIIPPSKREELWKNGKIVVSTPQVIENDLLAKRIDLREVSHITFDEAHRAVGKYAYTYISERYFKEAINPLSLAITASPGSTDDKITEICKNLHIKNIAVKTEEDSDVTPYIQKKNIEWIQINLPDEMKKIKDLLNKVLDDRYKKLADLGIRTPFGKKTSKTELLALQRKMQGEIRGGKPDPTVFSALSIIAEIMKVNHAIEVTETQGIEALDKYMERLENEAGSKNASKASRRLAEDLHIRQLYHRLKECGSEHPKLEAVKKIVADQLEEKPDSRVIVFTNYRDTAEIVTAALEEVSGISPVKFIGQSSKYKDKGLTQKQQVDIVSRFKQGKYNVLVATSVAEEGLDIPSTDLVLFYEPIPSEIRSIQRKGRTGRKNEGRVVVLVTKGTRDEGYYWSSKRKERNMQNSIRMLQDSTGNTAEELKTPVEKQQNLTDFEYKDDIQVIVDQREIRSTVARNLEKIGANLILKTLEVGDYVVSDRLAIERKDTGDFLNSLIEGKLFEQISNLSKAYKKGILILEGDGLFSSRMISPNSIHGALLSINLDFGIDVIYSRDAEDTASLIYLVAKREQVNEKRPVRAHGKKTARLLSEQQEYIVSSINEIGPVAARNLLTHFGSVEKVMSASEEELRKVKLIGPKTAAKIKEIVSSEYKA
ncbi:DEAD/DEAH box helicase [Methanohalophilus sp.]|uniref:DEAD/DEAH box helicase n=1 Tax=Methanohalophilus sp. TaxID=1966352 RepID=UPI002612CF44|nr:DEAD/DEAH box helicase [Methanohalophilus sp.]MDK2892898.1 hypothetical protein [Methanohalophilus sp.]